MMLFGAEMAAVGERDEVWYADAVADAEADAETEAKARIGCGAFALEVCAVVVVDEGGVAAAGLALRPGFSIGVDTAGSAIVAVAIDRRDRTRSSG